MNKVENYFYGKLVQNQQLTELLKRAFAEPGKIVYDEVYAAFYYNGDAHWTTINNMIHLDHLNVAIVK